MCLVSVIIPYYNRQATLPRALASVAAQTYKNYEVILVDDGSTDHSYELVERFKLEHLSINIVNIKQQNMGPSMARNLGIQHASGEYIAFLDSDDEWLPHKLERQLPLMQHYGIDMLGSNYFLVQEGEPSEFSFTREQIKTVTFKESLIKHYFATPCVVVRRKALLDVGLFPEKQHFMEDAYVFSNIARKYKACLTAEPLVNIYKLPYGQSGLSAQLKLMEKYELANLRKFRKENDQYENKLSVAFYIIATIFSIMKYLKRVLTVKLRNK